MRHFNLEDIKVRGSNVLAFWIITNDHQLHIQRKRLPDDTPEWVKNAQSFYNGSTYSLVKYFRDNEYLPLRECLDKAKSILAGKWN